LADDAVGATADDAADLAGNDAENLGGLVDVDDPNKRIAETVARISAPRRTPPNDVRHAELLQLRGSDAPTPRPRPADWTGNLEAEWRGYPEPPDGHEWYWREGNIELRYKKNTAGGDVPRYHYDGKDFVVFSGEDVKRARYKTKQQWPIYSKLKARLERLVRSRRRSAALRDFGEFSFNSAEPWERRLPAHQPADSSPNFSTTTRGQADDFVSNQHRRMTRASELLGEETAARWVQDTYSNAIPVHGWPPSGAPGGSGTFDQVWRVPGAGPDGGDLWLVVEAKGATADSA
jgi:hypothetical protein